LARPVYRARQVLTALFPRISQGDLQVVQGLLSEGELDLFYKMEVRDQRHGIEVMRRLRAAGIEGRDALAAALLHDCGKGWVPVWLRMEYVRAPRRVAGLAERAPVNATQAESISFDSPLLRERTAAMAAYRLVHHARIGAALARQAGSTDTTVRLISGIVGSDEEAALLAALQIADDQS
jgi:hypothetical protein